MNKIHVLSDDVSSKIAAGEVIERPASVIRELLDNSIDAGSSEISVKIENAGIKKIIVSDNGNGILKDDMFFALEKHATSKIKNIDDLKNLKTMGFRGEALHSIATISKITIVSNTDETGKTAGQKISNFGTDTYKVVSTPAKKGTKIEVCDIFYNIPARRKFLKSATTELNALKKAVSEKALSHLEISFRFYNDENQIFSTKGNGDFEEAFFTIYKNETGFKINEYYETLNSDLKIKIYYSSPEVFFPNRKFQLFYVNSRPVSVSFFYPSLDNGARNYISPGRYPLFYVFLEIDPSLIDVNIHPAKKEIKFDNPNEIFDSIQKSVSIALGRIFKREILDMPGITYEVKTFQDTSGLFKKENYGTDLAYFEKISRENLDESEKKVENSKDYQIFGVAFDTYIIAEKKDRIYLIDQHAAAEAIIFKRKKDNYEKNNSIEKLLIPAVIEVEKWDKTTEEKIEILNKNGFHIERNEGTAITVREVPQILLSKKDYSLACEIITEFLESKEKIDKNITDMILIESSCKEAIKKGDKLNLVEMAEIVEEYFKLGINNCPHGRPVHFELSKESLEKVFQRRK